MSEGTVKEDFRRAALQLAPIVMQQPPCGLYRTLGVIGGIPADRLVYFHNHGDPGPGLYLPTGWKRNRVEIAERGTTLSDVSLLRLLEPLPPEGLYRVAESFHCCQQRCRLFEPETLLQLGYNAEGRAIAFVPEFVVADGTLAFPTSGTLIDHDCFVRLKLLKVEGYGAAPASAGHTALH